MASWAKVPIEVLFDERLTKRQIKVLIALLSFKNQKTGKCQPKRRLLGERCGLDINRISTITGELVALGWLVKKGKGGFSKSTRYCITIPTTLTEMVTVTEMATVTETVRGHPYQNGKGHEGYQNSKGHRTDQNKQSEQGGGGFKKNPESKAMEFTEQEIVEMIVKGELNVH